MPKHKVDPEVAYDYYRSLGPTRTLAKAAKHFGVTTRTLENYSMKGGWEDRLTQEGFDENPYSKLASEYCGKILEEMLRQIRDKELGYRNISEAAKLGEFLMKIMDRGIRPEEEQSIAKEIKAHAHRFGLAG